MKKEKQLFHPDGRVAHTGDTLISMNGEEAVLLSIELPHHSGSTGRVYVRWITDDEEPISQAYFPSVFGLAWRYPTIVITSIDGRPPICEGCGQPSPSVTCVIFKRRAEGLTEEYQQRLCVTCLPGLLGDEGVVIQ